jgi:predicted RNA-binding protein Jag
MEQKKQTGRYRKTDYKSIGKIDRILIDIQKKLKHSHQPISLDHLTAFERKRIHSFFDNKSDFQTKTYRNDDQYTLKIFPIGNLKKIADERAQQVIETGESYFWENLGNYERFIVHDHLKEYEGIETTSSGEGNNRRLEIKQKQFGRGLKKIMKKIKLF